MDSVSKSVPCAPTAAEFRFPLTYMTVRQSTPLYLPLWPSAARNLLRCFSVEVIATPVTYLVVGWHQAAETADALDRRTDFNPFAWAAESA